MHAGIISRGELRFGREENGEEGEKWRARSEICMDSRKRFYYEIRRLIQPPDFVFNDDKSARP